MFSEKQERSQMLNRAFINHVDMIKKTNDNIAMKI